MAAPPQPTVTTHNDFGTVNVIETPTSPSSAFTLSRFEFETGTTGNEGTKILMVEFDAGAALGIEKETAETAPAANLDDWEVKWDGKEVLTNIHPIRDPDTPASTCRLYFLLPPGAPIPTLVTISHTGPAAIDDLRTKPLPAIFPEGLKGQAAAGAVDKGTRGVLHTIWGKRRLEQLEAEIAAEMKSNGESVGLEMALQERQYLYEHFGLRDESGAIPLASALGGQDGAGAPASPVSPRSPVGGRLGEKLKGLKLATSPAELAKAKEANHAQTKKFTAIVPDSAPAGFQPMSMATGTASGMASLSAVMQGGPGAPERGADTDEPEDLFALPMSPRSPEMAMSPFSMLKS